MKIQAIKSLKYVSKLFGREHGVQSEYLEAVFEVSIDAFNSLIRWKYETKSDHKNLKFVFSENALDVHVLILILRK